MLNHVLLSPLIVKLLGELLQMGRLCAMGHLNKNGVHNEKADVLDADVRDANTDSCEDMMILIISLCIRTSFWLFPDMIYLKPPIISKLDKDFFGLVSYCSKSRQIM